MGMAKNSDLHERFDKLEAMVSKMCDKMFGAPDEAEKSLSEDIQKALDERVSVLEKSATESKAPVRMAVVQPKPAVNEHIAKAAGYREKAMQATDPRLAQGYLSLALDIEKSL
jgi:hypothetical protein